MSRLVVLDTNCLVQMLSVHSPYRPAWQAFRDGKYLLCVSNEILNEYQVRIPVSMDLIFISVLLSKIRMIINL